MTADSLETGTEKQPIRCKMTKGGNLMFNIVCNAVIKEIRKMNRQRVRKITSADRRPT